MALGARLRCNGSSFKGLHATFMVCFALRLAGSGKVKWDYDKVAGIASRMEEQLPQAVKDLIESPAWRGGALIRLASDVSRPTAQEVSRHYYFLKPWVQAMPTTVPSAYMITDALLVLNELLNKRLFPVEPQESLMNKAAQEAMKLKKLLQSLRYLFRASGSIADCRQAVCCFSLEQKAPDPR